MANRILKKIGFTMSGVIVVSGLFACAKDNSNAAQYAPLTHQYSHQRIVSKPAPKVHANELLESGPAGGTSRSIFKGEDKSNQSFPSSYWDRNGFEHTTFFNSDLSRSVLTWNDFIYVDFSYADLRYSDLRASIYENVKFDHADLRGADMRQSSFENCSFTGAQMAGVIMTHDLKDILSLSETQVAEIHWTHETGPEPAGG